MTSLLTGWLFAALLGARHASEPDHLVAVSTLIADARGPRRTAWLGALWGMGHSFSLLAVGSLLLCLRLRMSAQAADGFELLVRAYRARSEPEREFERERDHGHEHGAPWKRPLGVGLVHGLAGSGALTALALANMPSIATGIVYMALFGLGSVLGMALIAGLGGWQLQRRLCAPNPRAVLGALAGTMSLVLGVLWGWPPALRLAGL
jgi:nickel/cobalt exporter